jgi:hypothetical protein
MNTTLKKTTGLNCCLQVTYQQLEHLPQATLTKMGTWW